MPNEVEAAVKSTVHEALSMLRLPGRAAPK
jgi:hypothetical protein